MTQQQADAAIVNAHLIPHDIASTSATVQKGHVIGTSPSAGTLLKANSTVTVSVSAGQQQVTVPSVVGEDQNTASAKLSNANLNPVIKTVQSTKPAGTAVSQNPPVGTKVNPNSNVQLSGSGRRTTVQSVVGDPVETAKNILQQQGVQVH